MRKIYHVTLHKINEYTVEVAASSEDKARALVKENWLTSENPDEDCLFNSSVIEVIHAEEAPVK